MIDSPCVGVCTNLFDDICKGCGRTAEEVFRWVEMTEEEKKLILDRLNDQNSQQEAT